MTVTVIDTNLLVHACDLSHYCCDDAIEFLSDIIDALEVQPLALDQGNVVRGEYERNLKDQRPYAVGKEFFIKALDRGWVVYFDIETPSERAAGVIEQLKILRFDRKDFKWILLALHDDAESHSLFVGEDSDYVKIQQEWPRLGVKVSSPCGSRPEG